MVYKSTEPEKPIDGDANLGWKKRQPRMEGIYMGEHPLYTFGGVPSCGSRLDLNLLPKFYPDKFEKQLFLLINKFVKLFF